MENKHLYRKCTRSFFFIDRMLFQNSRKKYCFCALKCLISSEICASKHLQKSCMAYILAICQMKPTKKKYLDDKTSSPKRS